MNATALPLTRGALQVLQVLGGPLALMPDARQQLLDVVERHVQGDTRDLSVIQAKLGRPLGAEQRDGYQVTNGVAVLGVQGTIFPKSNLMTDISGGASAQLIARDVAQAAADPGVQAIVLSIDSPGGSVSGIPEASQAIRDAALRKPVVTHSDGVLASAAYWLGSSANAVYVSGPGVMVGSIGVVATHTDSSRAQAAAGVQKTEIAAGKYKVAASPNKPLDAKGAASLQAQVDYIYGLFVDAVALNRGATVEAVLANMADGRIFIGQQAIDAGLVDGFQSLERLVASLAANPAAYAKRGAAPAARSAAAALRPAASWQGQASRAGVAHPLDDPATAAARLYAADHGLSVLHALRALRASAEPSQARADSGQRRTQTFVPPRNRAVDAHAQARDAQAFAQRHGVSFLVAHKALGFDPDTSDFASRVQRHAIERGISPAEAAKALSRKQ